MNTVRSHLTPYRRRDVVENDEFAAFATRIVRAHGRRVAAGDVEALRDLIGLQFVLEDAVEDAVDGLRRWGYSWGEIAARLGITKQTAHERWASTVRRRAVEAGYRILEA